MDESSKTMTLVDDFEDALLSIHVDDDDEAAGSIDVDAPAPDAWQEADEVVGATSWYENVD